MDKIYLLFFVDCTENPYDAIVISTSAIGEEDPDFASSCYVNAQKLSSRHTVVGVPVSHQYNNR
ncbi:hypothetical protein DIJ64_12140 [Mycobacterium leprae]|uniref:Uncharacterized protein n=1 Tax=Mycobacterium leprae TaxID=1769 RepID=A0AAD0P8K7_MYCLR|nr:hypothetical protein DIJ64_12140 [Mycobacterium leprae]OAR20015.1 hypothetical protein A8144_03455 [Mycobacterium leprae 3125609]OAX71466.1 hypothetical protein A3216_05545 [Mycobacterium leprae 7935681]